MKPQANPGDRRLSQPPRRRPLSALRERFARAAGAEARLSGRPWLTTLWSVVAVAAVWLSPLATPLEGLGERAEFRVREALDRAPAIDPMLKILTFDDHAADALRGDMSEDDWGVLLDGLARAKVRAVLIDKIFGLPSRPGPGLEHFKAALGAGPPVYAGAFSLPNQTLARPSLALDRPEMLLSTYAAWSSAEAPPAWLVATGAVAYGPNSELAPRFRGLGQIMVEPGARVRPFRRLSPDVVMPHLALLAGQDVRIEARGVRIGDRWVPTDSRGELLPNLGPVRAYYASSAGLATAFGDAAAGRPLTGLRPGQTVLVLPNLFTGSTDFVETPAGLLPGGFVIAALVSSVLSGDWLSYREPGLAGLLLACLVGAAFGALLRPTWFAVATSAVAVAISAGGLALFCYAGVVLPWVLPALACAGTGIAVFVNRMRAQELQAKLLQNALAPAVGAPRLREMLRHPELLPREAAEQIVTLMFIDIVGFSLAAEVLTPRQAFAELKAILSEIAKLVHQHGGVVDRSLGDGMLCYFGYAFGTAAANANHAEQAFQCAAAVQRRSVERCIAASNAEQAVFPLRVGLNTAAAYIGDLGDEHRFDFTVIGHGVNLAQRLEAACESHHVMLGATTMAHLVRMTPGSPGMRARLINVKHLPKPLEAFSYNPHVEAPGALADANQAHRKFAKLQRTEQRWAVQKPELFRLRTDFGDGRLIDYSVAGLAVELPVFLGKGLTVTIAVSDAAGAHAPVHSLIAEVRWGRPSGNRFVHGLVIKNLGSEQRDELFAFFRERERAAA